MTHLRKCAPETTFVPVPQFVNIPQALADSKIYKKSGLKDVEGLVSALGSSYDPMTLEFGFTEEWDEKTEDFEQVCYPDSVLLSHDTDPKTRKRRVVMVEKHYYENPLPVVLTSPKLLRPARPVGCDLTRWNLNFSWVSKYGTEDDISGGRRRSLVSQETPP